MRLPTPVALAAALAPITAVVTLAPAGPAAATGLHYEYGTITKVADGDTVYVDIAGDGKGGLPVRNANIQATEHGGENGLPECWANEAGDAMNRLVPPGTKVRLVVTDPSYTAGTDGAGVTRLLRYVDKYNPSTGAYDIDTQLQLLNAGLVLWGPSLDNTRVTAYHVAEDNAVARHAGMFGSPTHCGSTYAPGATLRMWTHYDANGDDAVINSEWIHIQNTGATAVSIAGWKLRDPGHSFYAGSTYFTFPAGSTIRAHGVVTVYAGTGTNSPSTGRFYLQHSTGNVFPNIADHTTLGYPGKTVYLLDPLLNFRVWADYPCLAGCSGPPVRISNVQYTTADEYVDLQLASTATAPADLSGVEVTNDGWTKELAPGTTLAPGETLRVYCDRTAADTRLVQYWGHTGGTMLEDTGDTVVVRTDTAVILDSRSWGNG